MKLQTLVRSAGSYLCIVLTTIWAVLALYFDSPFARIKIVLPVLYLACLVLACYWTKRKLLACLLGFAIVVSWWLTLKPTNQGPWQADVSTLASVDLDHGHAVIHGFRQCDYQTETDYQCRWDDRDVDLAQIRGVDLFMNYWGSPWIAHTIVSFDVGGGQHVAFSIETRKRPGQTYSALRGFFRQYTLMTVVSDERDLVRLRTNYRKGEDLYLYHINATPEVARSLFLDYVNMANGLATRPEWYNAVTRNCTTEIFTFKTMEKHPFDWRILFNGKADEMGYERGKLAGNLPFNELKKQAYINPAARAADKDPRFSDRIREGKPGF